MTRNTPIPTIQELVQRAKKTCEEADALMNTPLPEPPKTEPEPIADDVWVMLDEARDFLKALGD